MLAKLGFAWIVTQVMADVEVEVAIAVQVGEGGRGRPVAIAGQTGLARSYPRTARRPCCDRVHKNASA